MTTTVTLKLPDELYEQARRWSAITRQDVSNTLTNALRIVLTPVYVVPGSETPVSALPDEEVLALSQAQMKPAQGARLGELLETNREGLLTERERPELLALMQLYHELWVRQSEALVEAVRRGLREPLRP